MTTNYPVAATAASSTATATLLPVISWAVTSLHITMAENVQVSITVGLVVVAHWLGQQIAAYCASKNNEPPNAPISAAAPITTMPPPIDTALTPPIATALAQ